MEKEDRVEEILRYYKGSFVCLKCGRLYGSDFKKENNICRECSVASRGKDDRN